MLRGLKITECGKAAILRHLVWREKGVISWRAADRRRYKGPLRERYDRAVSHPCHRHSTHRPRRQPQLIEFDVTPRLRKSSFRENLSLSTPAISLGALRLRGAGKNGRDANQRWRAQIKFPFSFCMCWESWCCKRLRAQLLYIWNKTFSQNSICVECMLCVKVNFSHDFLPRMLKTNNSHLTRRRSQTELWNLSLF